MKSIADKVAKAWNITGPFNMQIIKDGDKPLKVIECNIRASRSFPFVSKVLGVNFIDIAVRAFLGGEYVPEPVDLMMNKKYDYVATKVPQFSFTRLAGADPFLGVEMASTGEVASFGRDEIESYWTAIQSTMNFQVPVPPCGILFGGDLTKDALGGVAKFIAPLDYKLYVTTEEAKEYLMKHIGSNYEVKIIEFPKNDKRKLRELFQEYDIKAVFNLASKRAENTDDLDYQMRRNAIDFAIPLFNEPKTSVLFAKALSTHIKDKVEAFNSDKVIVPNEVHTWEEYVGHRTN